MIVRIPTEDEIKNTENWDIWIKEPSIFKWYYPENETCYILEGEAIITDKNGNETIIKAGDWVEFPEGMECQWKITKKIKKRYYIG